MRLIKLIAYSLLGYVIYEIYQGFAEGSAGTKKPKAQKSAWGSPGLRYAPVSEAGNSSNESGGTRGKVVPVDEADGGHRKRVVGRGVVS